MTHRSTLGTGYARTPLCDRFDRSGILLSRIATIASYDTHTLMSISHGYDYRICYPLPSTRSSATTEHRHRTHHDRTLHSHQLPPPNPNKSWTERRRKHTKNIIMRHPHDTMTTIIYHKRQKSLTKVLHSRGIFLYLAPVAQHRSTCEFHQKPLLLVDFMLRLPIQKYTRLYLRFIL